MANVIYNRQKYNEMSGGINILSDAGVKMLLLKTITTTPDNPDHNFITNIVADEFSDTGYTGGFGGAGRKALANRAVTEDDTNDRAEFDFDDLTWTSLGGTQSVVFAAIAKEVTTDADSPLISGHDVADTVTDGSDFTLQVGADGAVWYT